MAEQPKSATVTVTKHPVPAPATAPHASPPPVPSAKAETKDAPAQQAIAGGETVTIATVTLAALLSQLFVTNTAPTPPTIATWVFPGVLQGVYGDQSIFTIRFEARPYAPSLIRVT